MQLTGKEELINKIKQKIQQEGAISFKDFMEMALYYPNLGYYTSEKKKSEDLETFIHQAN
jgi:Uncharacterized conserved protein